VYLIGALAVTVAINIPLNNRLAAVNPASVEASGSWAEFLPRWVLWNHVRAVSAIAAAGAFIAAISARH
jgi:uncharacterized membrane protein